MHEITMQLSPKYMGWRTTEYVHDVRIREDMGVTAKLLPSENNETKTITKPTRKQRE